MSSCETPKHSTNAMAPFSRAPLESFNDWGDVTILSPRRSPKQALPGIGLHSPLHGRQACPEFNSFYQGVGQICPREGLLCAVSSENGDKFVTSPPPPPQPLNESLNLVIALFIGALSWVGRSRRSFFPRCAWRAREGFDWTRGTTTTHTPPTPRLVRLSSTPIGLGCQRILPLFSLSNTPALAPPPLSPAPPSPLPSPPPLLLLPLLIEEFLSLSLEGPLPPLGLPMNCPLRPLFDLSWLRWSWYSALHWVPDAMGRSGSHSRRDGRFPRAGEATTRPWTRAWQPIYVAPLMELLLVSPKSPSRIGKWACRRTSCPR